MISCIYILKIKLTCTEHDINKMFSKIDQSLENKVKKTTTNKINKETNRVSNDQGANEKLYENCKIVELYEKQTA